MSGYRWSALGVVASLLTGCGRGSSEPAVPAAALAPISPAHTVSLSGEITALADGDPAATVVMGLSDGRVGSWNGLDRTVTLHKAHGNRVVAVGATADGRGILSLSSEGSVGRTIMADDATTELSRVDVKTAPVGTASFSPDGDQLLVGGRDGNVRVFETASGRQRHALSGHRADLYALVMPPKAPILASASADADLRIWDLSSGTELHLADNDLAMLAAAFSPRDDSLIAGGTDRRVTLRRAGAWKADTLVTLSAPEIVSALAWSPDAATIAVASVDETSLAKGWLRLIDAASRTIVAQLDTRGQPAWWVAFLDNDTVVATVDSEAPLPAGAATSRLLAWDR